MTFKVVSILFTLYRVRRQFYLYKDMSGAHSEKMA